MIVENIGCSLGRRRRRRREGWEEGRKGGREEGRKGRNKERGNTDKENIKIKNNHQRKANNDNKKTIQPIEHRIDVF